NLYYYAVEKDLTYLLSRPYLYIIFQYVSSSLIALFRFELKYFLLMHLILASVCCFRVILPLNLM
ncbi:MAG TPA: hypothetical protein PLH86_07875, partial [Saprospiraceae bacterium]|nr:hypothetical protein [Saprospiraceae bacterium]